MTKTAMIKERDLIWNDYMTHRGVIETKRVEIMKTAGFGIFIGTGEYKTVDEWVRDMTMEEWNAEKAERYKFLNNAVAEYEKENAKKEKIRRYKKELIKLKERTAYIENWLKENN